MMRTAGRDKDGRAKGLTVENDPNDRGVLRVVDAAPFAYNVDRDTFRTENGALLNAVNNIGFTGLDANEIPLARAVLGLDTFDFKFFFPLQEANSKVANDLSGKGYLGQKYGVLTDNTDGTKASRRMGLFGSIESPISFIRVPSVAGTRGLDKFTFFATVEIKDDGMRGTIYSESSATDHATARFLITKNADRTITLHLRPNDSALFSVTTNNPVDPGFHMLFVTVDLADNRFSIYLNGSSALPVTQSGQLPSATTMPNTNSYVINVGLSGTPLNQIPETASLSQFKGSMSNIGLVSPNLGLGEIRILTSEAGFRI